MDRETNKFLISEATDKLRDALLEPDQPISAFDVLQQLAMIDHLRTIETNDRV